MASQARQEQVTASYDTSRRRPALKFGDSSHLLPRDNTGIHVRSSARNRDRSNDEFEHYDGTNARSTMLVHKPQSPEDAFTIRTVVAIECEGASKSWYAHVPSRIGHCKTVDLCINALVLGSDCVRGLPGATLSKCYLVIADAFDSLRIALSSQEAVLSDDILISIAVLAPVEAVLGGHSLIGHSHLEGLTAIMTTRPTPARDKITEVTRSILDYYYSDAFVIACVRGIVSPLEVLDRAYYEYSGDTAVAADGRLKALANELYIRLPRLVALIRAARLREPEAPFEAALQAKSLFRLKDDSAETEVSHRVNVRINTTRPTGGTSLTRCYFQFRTVADFDAIVSYWQARLALMRLCWLIRPSNLSEFPSLPCHTQIQADVRRLSSSLLMSAEYARTLRVRGRRRLFALSMITVWAPLGQLPGILPAGTDLKTVQDWLLAEANEALVGHTALTIRDMYEAAELFVGGAPTGVYAQLYRKHDEHRQADVVRPAVPHGFLRRLERNLRQQASER